MSAFRRNYPEPSLLYPELRNPSLPLDRPGRLARHVIDDPVDAFHFVDDAGGDAGEEGVLEGIGIRGHAVR